MKIIKKFKMLVVAVFLFFIVGNVSAATTITVDNGQLLESDPQSYLVTNTGELRVDGIQTGDALSAYRILDTYYNESTNQISYDFTDDFKGFLAQSSTYRDMTVETYQGLTSGSITSGSTTSQSTLDALASAYAAYIKKNTVTASATALNVSGNTASATLPAGAYLVLPTETTRIYAVMVGNIEFKAEDNAWNLENVTIVAKVSDARVDKKVGTTSNSEGSFGIMDTINYYITATVPQYPTNATNKTFVVTDTMSAGLTFNGIESITIYDGETQLNVSSDGRVMDSSMSNPVGMIEVSGQVITFDFILDNVKSTTLKISYRARLNASAGLGLAGGNKNGATLQYSNDPYGTGTYTTDARNSETTVYTYALKVLSYETGNESTVLEGATFDLYADVDLNNKITSISTDASGTGQNIGLASGTYYLKQTKAPSGYSLLRDSIPVTISDATDEGDTGVVTVKVAATKIGALPITGGFGTIAFTVSGIMIIAAAILFVVVYKRRKKEQQQTL